MGSELTGDYRSGASAETKRPPTVRNKSAIRDVLKCAELRQPKNKGPREQSSVANRRIDHKGGNAMDRLRDKVVIVAGGAQGLGDGIARRLAEEGASVVIADINGAKAKSVAASMTREGKQAIAVTLDVAERKQVQRGDSENG
jgi:FlaA1/EpsC-like NDP-sugar epimerase